MYLTQRVNNAKTIVTIPPKMKSFISFFMINRDIPNQVRSEIVNITLTKEIEDFIIEFLYKIVLLYIVQPVFAISFLLLLYDNITIVNNNKMVTTSLIYALNKK